MSSIVSAGRPFLQGPRILPGEFRVSSGGEHLQTLVGSCIAACIWDPVRRCGGMNHFLLAESSDRPEQEAARYGLYAMELLINGLLESGADRNRLEVKIAGGARVTSGTIDIGGQNIAFIRSFLVRERLILRAQDVGGTAARRIVFACDTGQMWVRHLDARSTLQVESERRSRVPHAESTVELF